MPANPLTKEQLEEAAKLKALFKEWQAARRDNDERVSQEKAAESLGMGQSALSQYLNGGIPLNLPAATKIAELIGCQVSDFSPSLANEAAGYISAAPPSEIEVNGKQSGLVGVDELLQLISLYGQATEVGRRQILRMARNCEKISPSNELTAINNKR